MIIVRQCEDRTLTGKTKPAFSIATVGGRERCFFLCPYHTTEKLTFQWRHLWHGSCLALPNTEDTMNRRIFPRSAAMLLVMLLAAPPLRAQTVRGRVVDEQTRQPVRNAPVSLLRPDTTSIAQTTTDRDGFFQFTIPTAGQYIVAVKAPGYATAAQSFRGAPDEPVLLPALVLSAEAIALDTVEASARRTTSPGELVAGYPVAKATARLSGARLLQIERQGLSPLQALRQLSGLRVRTVRRAGQAEVDCVESTRGISSMGNPDAARVTARGSGGRAQTTSDDPQCDPVAIVVDGIVMSANFSLREIHVAELESIEYLTSLEAGVRWPNLVNGAVVLWTRGRGPHRSDARSR